MMLGKIGPLTRGEAELTGPYQLQPRPMARAWEYWAIRLEKSGGMPSVRRTASKSRGAKSRSAKSQGAKSQSAKSQGSKSRKR
jgi:hypothetical protein